MRTDKSAFDSGESDTENFFPDESKRNTTKRKRINNLAMQEFYEERAGILQYMAGYPKEKAEALAKAELKTYIQKKAKHAG